MGTRSFSMKLSSREKPNGEHTFLVSDLISGLYWIRSNNNGELSTRLMRPSSCTGLMYQLRH